jgi:hypothetical protein
LIRPNPSVDTARTTFIHFGIIVWVAPILRPIAFHENEYRVTSTR